MAVRLAFLGTGTCNATKRNPLSLAISINGELILVDIGGGAYHQLPRLNDDDFQYKNISTIFITHFHIDHVSGLPDLFWGEMWDHLGRRETALTIIGPKGLNNFYNNRFLPFLGDYPLPFQVKLYELSDGEWYNATSYSVRSFHLNHSEFSTGYLFELPTCKLAISGDTGYCENLVELLKSSDIAVLEWSITDFNTYPGHISTSDIVKLIKLDALPQKTYIVHMYPIAGMDMETQQKKCKELLGEKSIAIFFPEDMEIIDL
ncbi:MAG: MBL fold metallo-hydrolase [Spirochaetes bacterium]|nr:MBL fold metallo-hydrolase [Spirochaetota bacterium]